MEIKYTFLGLLIYLAMAGHLLAFVTSLSKKRKAANFFFATGFGFVAIAFFYRWYTVEHVPFQNLFEVFLCLGLLYPVSVFCRKKLRVSGEGFDALLAAVVLYPAGFVFDADPKFLPPALQSWLFTPHVACYMIAYMFMAKAAYQAVLRLCGAGDIEGDFLPHEEGTYKMISVGFPLLTAGLLLGSYWGKRAWGDWWGWDPKELWSLASWLVYVGYFHYRSVDRAKHPRVNSVWAIAGLVVIIITLLWVNLSKIFPGLHSYAT